MLQEGMKQLAIHRLTVGLIYGLLVCLVIGLPGSATAQFIPIEQAKEQEQTKQDQHLSDILSQINSKGASAKRQIAAIFDDVAKNKSTAANAERKSATVIDKLKSQLNDLLTDYTKKSPAPSGTSLRSGYDAAQQILNDVRRQVDEGLDQAQLSRQENPNQLTGKYLKYQEKIKIIADKGVKKADDRLSERGTKDSVKRDLQQLIVDTESQIEVATTSFLSVNPELLASAVQRIKKSILDVMSEAMSERYKKAEERGNDKALDLSTQEQEDLTVYKKELVAVVDRAIQTAEQLTEQIANSQLPTTSELPGVNPLLEAKFKAEKQLKEIQTSVTGRLATMNTRYQARTDVSPLAKEVAARETDREKSRLTDSVNEYLDYFTAGDPTKKKYNKAKRDAQDEAEGCDSFLCDFGRAVTGVARGVIKSTTNVDIGPAGQQFISNGIFQIDDPNPYARSKYQTGTPRYTTIPGGATASGNLQYNPTRCLTDASTATGKKFAFIETAQAQDLDDWLQLEMQQERESAQPAQTTGTRDRTLNDLQNEEDFNSLWDAYYGNNNATAAQRNTNFQQALDDIYGPSAKATPKPNLVTKLGIPFLGELLTRRTTTTVAQGQYACNSYPNQAYSSPFGATPVSQLLGYNTPNLQPGFNQSNWQPLMQSLFQLAAQKDPCYSQVTPYFNGGITSAEYNMMAQYLAQKCNFYTLPADNPYWMGPVTNNMRHLCVPQFIAGNPQMARLCANAWVPGTGGTPPFIPVSSSGWSSNFSIGELLKVPTGTGYEKLFDAFIATTNTPAKPIVAADPSYQQAFAIVQQIATYVDAQGGFEAIAASRDACNILTPVAVKILELTRLSTAIIDSTQRTNIRQTGYYLQGQHDRACRYSGT
jgi:hypothetical protein